MLTQADYTEHSERCCRSRSSRSSAPAATPSTRYPSRYRVEVDVRTATDAILYGLGIRPLSDGGLRLILAWRPSPRWRSGSPTCPSGHPGAAADGRRSWSAWPRTCSRSRRPTWTRNGSQHVPDVLETWLRQASERCRCGRLARSSPRRAWTSAWHGVQAMRGTLVVDRGRGRWLSPKCSLYRSPTPWPGRPTRAWPPEHQRPRVLDPDRTIPVPGQDMAAERAYEHLAGVARGDAPRFTDAPATDPSGDPSLGADGERRHTTDPLAGADMTYHLAAVRIRSIGERRRPVHRPDHEHDRSDHRLRPPRTVRQVVWLRNGGGKPSIMALFYAMILPRAVELPRQTAALTDYVDNGTPPHRRRAPGRPDQPARRPRPVLITARRLRMGRRLLRRSTRPRTGTASARRTRVLRRTTSWRTPSRSPTSTADPTAERVPRRAAPGQRQHPQAMDLTIARIGSTNGPDKGLDRDRGIDPNCSAPRSR